MYAKDTKPSSKAEAKPAPTPVPLLQHGFRLAGLGSEADEWAALRDLRSLPAFAQAKAMGLQMDADGDGVEQGAAEEAADEKEAAEGGGGKMACRTGKPQLPAHIPGRWQTV